MVSHIKELKRTVNDYTFMAFIFPIPSKKEYIYKHIPNALDILPFKAQSLDAENFGEDLKSFLNSLYNDQRIAEFFFNYRLKDSIKYWYDKILEEITKDIENPPPALEITSRTINQNILLNVLKALKYNAAWKSLIQWCLEEEVFFDIGYIVEIEDEIESSILLCSNFLYKQAFYSIRSFLEMSLLYIYYSLYPEEYEKWKNNLNYKAPFFHKRKNSLISILRNDGILSSKNAEKLSKLYTKLNAYVHSRPDSITNRGYYNGNWIGRHYNPDFLLEWTENFIKATELMLRIFCEYLIKWSSNLDLYLEGKCPICHSSDFFKYSDPIFQEIVIYKCKKCNNDISYYEGKRVNIVRNYKFMLKKDS